MKGENEDYKYEFGLAVVKPEGYSIMYDPGHIMELLDDWRNVVTNLKDRNNEKNE